MEKMNIFDLDTIKINPHDLVVDCEQKKYTQKVLIKYNLDCLYTMNSLPNSNNNYSISS